MRTPHCASSAEVVSQGNTVICQLKQQEMFYISMYVYFDNTCVHLHLGIHELCHTWRGAAHLYLPILSLHAVLAHGLPDGQMQHAQSGNYLLR